MFYNIQNNNAPMYLCDLIPPEEEMIGVFAIGTTTTRRIWDYIYLEQIVISGKSMHVRPNRLHI
jgi:hypothetical protein